MAKKVQNAEKLGFGDVITLSDLTLTLIPLSPQEQEEKAKNQSENVTKTYSPAFSLCLLMVFHVLTAIQLIGTVKAESKGLVLLVFTLLIAIEWIYYFAMKAFRKTGLEVEIIAFFLSNMGFSVVSSSYSALLLKQFIAFVIGMVGFVLLGNFSKESRSG